MGAAAWLWLIPLLSSSVCSMLAFFSGLTNFIYAPYTVGFGSGLDRLPRSNLIWSFIV